MLVGLVSLPYVEAEIRDPHGKLKDMRMPHLRRYSWAWSWAPKASTQLTLITSHNRSIETWH